MQSLRRRPRRVLLMGRVLMGRVVLLGLEVLRLEVPVRREGARRRWRSR